LLDDYAVLLFLFWVAAAFIDVGILLVVVVLVVVLLFYVLVLLVLF
jgi:hypothetical protein